MRRYQRNRGLSDSEGTDNSSPYETDTRITAYRTEDSLSDDEDEMPIQKGRRKTRLAQGDLEPSFSSIAPSDKEEYSLQSARNREWPGARSQHARDRSHEDFDTSPATKAVHRELQVINDKLKQELRILQERGAVQKEKERILEEREHALSVDKANFQKFVSAEIQRQLLAKEQEYRLELEKGDLVLKEKIRENKRLKENFDTLKTANDTLRKELETLQQQHDKLEKQSTSLQARLTNLQRKNEFTDKKDTDYLPAELMKRKPQKENKDLKNKIASKPCLGTYDLLAVVLEWLSEVHLRHMLTPGHTHRSLELSSSDMHEKCIKVLPSLVEIIREVPAGNLRIILPCLQFIYWALVHLDSAQTNQRTSMASTLRRLGEELYKARGGRGLEDSLHDGAVSVSPTSRSEPQIQTGDGVFMKSHNIQVRFLSCMILLKTLSQVDHLAQVFEVMRNDLKTDTAKQLFQHYQGTASLIPFLKPTNKMQMNNAVDIYLAMSVDSPVLVAFLDSCSTEAWFRSSSMILRMPGPDEKVVEKLSILLQKLSKIKSNKRYFEVFGITLAAQEMLRTTASDNAFLSLNLKSILFNLNSKPPAGV